MVALLVIGTIVVCLLVDYFVQRAEKRVKMFEPAIVSSFKLEQFVLPRGYFFSKAHTWAQVLFSGKVYVGVDDFITKVVGKVESIEVPEIGSEVKRGEPLLRIRQDGKILTFRSPITGKVVGVNENIFNAPELLESDPYLEGWIVMIEPKNIATEIKSLLIGEEASAWLRNEFKRFMEFIKDNAPRFSLEPTLADGGAIIRGVLRNVNEQIWENFEKSFLSEI